MPEETTTEVQSDLTETQQHEVEMIEKAIEAGQVELPPNMPDAKTWVKSAEDTRKALTQTQQENAELRKSQTTEEISEEPEAEEGEPVTSLKIPEPEAEAEVPEGTGVDWDELEREVLHTGSLSDESRKILKAADLPDSVVNNWEKGQQALAREQTREAAAIVGGEDELKAILKFASTLSQEERESYDAAISNPTLVKAALLDLKERKGKTAKTAPSGSVNPTAGGGYEPFLNTTDSTRHFNDPRYGVDEEFTKMTQMRHYLMIHGKMPE